MIQIDCIASQTSSWFGQIIQRSDDGGKTWSQPGSDGSAEKAAAEGMPQGESNMFVYDTSEETGKPLTTHQWYDGTQHPWEFARVGISSLRWTIRTPVMPVLRMPPCFVPPMAVQAGRNSRGCAATSRDPTGRRGPAACACTRSSLTRQTAANFLRHFGGRRVSLRRRRPTWKPINQGLHSDYIPNPTAEVGHCVHRIAIHPSNPNTLFMQKHWDVLRSDDGGDSWREVSGNLPSDFGFPIAVHAHDPETIYVVPIQSDSLHYPPEGKLRVYRSKSGGEELGGADEGPATGTLLR